MKLKYLVETIGDTLKENAPEIYMGLGILGVGAGVVLACKATRKIEEPVTKLAVKRLDISEKLEDDVTYTKAEYNKDIAKSYAVMIWDYVKLYGPAFATLFFAILAFFKAYGKLSCERDLYAAAFTATLSEFNQYRKRVVEKYGEDEDRKLRHGAEHVVITDIDEKGKAKETEYTVSNPYTFVFDNGNRNWSSAWDRDRNWDMPKAWLIMLQNELQNEIERRAKYNPTCPGVGIMKLNELYKKLDMPQTELGDRAIWVYINRDMRPDLTPIGDNKIDLRLFCTSVKNNDFLNGIEKCIYIDPNIDGDIYTLNKEYGFRPIK